MNALPLVAPALPLHTAGKYVAAAYVVFFTIVVIYVAIMATRLNRMDRELGDLLGRLSARSRARHVSDSDLSTNGELVVDGDLGDHDEEPAAEAPLPIGEESARA